MLLFDINPELYEAWEEAFKDVAEVSVLCTKFENVCAKRVVTAGNSYGWMTGGIDLAVRNYYGQWIQDEVQRQILLYHNRRLPVGKSIAIETRDRLKPTLIYAPTMELPRFISEIDVFFVFANLLLKYGTDIACCGLGTATGGLSAKECARAMRKAYDYVYMIRREDFFKSVCADVD